MTDETARSARIDRRLTVLAEVSTDTTLELPEGMSYEAWQGVGDELHRIEKGISWWLGDWWRYGERHYGELASQAVSVGYAEGTIRAAAWVADAFPPERRRKTVSWAHHREVAALEPPEQDRFLDRAEAEGMTRDHLRAAVRKEQTGDSSSETMRLLRRAAETFRRDEPDEGMVGFCQLAEKAWTA